MLFLKRCLQEKLSYKYKHFAQLNATLGVKDSVLIDQVDN